MKMCLVSEVRHFTYHRVITDFHTSGGPTDLSTHSSQVKYKGKTPKGPLEVRWFKFLML